uniref:Uncharacterized protein n=1 Tax=Candidatus Kentrum sp. TUN TaxID=2126343 RepID=A0A450ZIE5_9GAMM|nr:MAG: hypothetical protein BECKTUN1418F_GA0071002_102510 [Candidatus Kentron sp. TUN]VFK54277.1 MAG: hypothetical protein BECKTUN1418D_GA0071000_102110 [Candidatus Kentron sp. TUN]VFK55132.1 MAG: hypothetical protein BECKTUN1418E_GA0071001_102510 [Candidatus Kentron sp. TUN]
MFARVYVCNLFKVSENKNFGESVYRGPCQPWREALTCSFPFSFANGWRFIKCLFRFTNITSPSPFPSVPVARSHFFEVRLECDVLRQGLCKARVEHDAKCHHRSSIQFGFLRQTHQELNLP